MPRLPSLTDNARPLAQSSGGIASYRPEPNGQTVIGRALVQVGGVVSNIEQRLEVEQERQDRLVADDVLNKSRTAALDLEVGPNGFANVRGEAAVKQPIFKDYTGKLDTINAGLTKGLTPRQKDLVKQRLDAFGLQFKESLLRHSMAENKAYAENVFKGTLDVEQKYVAANYEQPNAVALSLVRVEDAVLERAERLGLPKEATKAAMLQTIGGLHQTVLDQALAGGSTDYASQYLKTARAEMTPEQVKAVEAKLKPATDWALGKSLADTAIARIEAGKDRVEVEKELSTKAKTPGVFSAAKSLLTEFDQAVHKRDAEQEGGLLERFAAAPTRATMNALLRDDAYLSMNDARRGKLSEYLRNQVEQNETAANARRSEQWQKPEVFAKFMDTLDDPNFPTKSRAEIYALAPEIGPSMTSKLLAEHARLNQETKSFKIPPALIDQVIPPALQRATTEAEKTKKAAIKGIIQSALMEWKANNPGKTPDEKELNAILAAPFTQYKLDKAGWFGGDVIGKVFDLKPMPDDFRAAAYAEAERRGLPRPSETKLLQQWAKQKGAR